MYEYKIKQWLLSELLEEMYWKWFRLANYDKELKISVWDKEIKKTIKRIDEKEFTEWLEFIKFYRTINKHGSYDKTLIRKYRIKLDEWNSHQTIMWNLSKYKLHLESFKSKPPLQVWTYLNQNRFLDEYKLDKKFYENKWKTEILENQKVPKLHSWIIMKEADIWEQTNKNKEMTSHLFQKIINKFYIPKNEKILYKKQ